MPISSTWIFVTLTGYQSMGLSPSLHFLKCLLIIESWALHPLPNSSQAWGKCLLTGWMNEWMNEVQSRVSKPKETSWDHPIAQRLVTVLHVPPAELQWSGFAPSSGMLSSGFSPSHQPSASAASLTHQHESQHCLWFPWTLPAFPKLMSPRPMAPEPMLVTPRLSHHTPDII